MNDFPSKTDFEHVYRDKTYALLTEEFPQDENICYLEHAGATLYSSRQISDFCNELKNNIFANPHARSTSSKLTEDVIDQIRIQILQHFNTVSKDYSVIFTSGATGALKLLAESFNYENDGTFAHLQDNHTSVLGMREFAKNTLPITTKKAQEIFKTTNNNHKTTESNFETNSLFVFPAQSNFSGTKYDLDWIEKAQNGVLDNAISNTSMSNSLNGCTSMSNSSNGYTLMLNSSNGHKSMSNSLNGYTSLSSSSKWFCCLDAASFVATNYLDLSKYRPDFVCVSFYKIFGYPTGLGALIVKNDSAHVLKRNYFGGGTVFMALATEKVMVPRICLHEKFEDGTLPFLSILSLRHGFSTFKRLQINMDDISKHTFNLAKYTHDKMATLHHSNGRRLCQLYTDNNFENIQNQGGIVNFNLLDSNGHYIGFAQVLHIANLFGIQVRTGCFCNPGACQEHLNLTIEDLNRHFEAGHVCGDQNDLIDGQPTGSVRISFGYMSTKQDADTFLKTITDCFCQKPTVQKIPDFNTKNVSNGFHNNCEGANEDSSSHIVQNGGKSKQSSPSEVEGRTGVLKNIYIYPIKSCAAYEVETSWILTNKGLKFDRNWMIVNDSGVCVTQKQNINLCKIKPVIDLDEDALTLYYEDVLPTSIPLSLSLERNKLSRANTCQTKVCKDIIEALDCGDSVAGWISTALNQSGLRLLRQNDGDSSRCTKSNAAITLVNEAQYLLINLSSIKWLLSQIKDPSFGDDINNMIYRFRPNFVVDFDLAFVENDFTAFSLENDLHFSTEGHCTRCQMICYNQLTGEKTVEPLKTLSKLLNGKISFGLYLRKCDNTACDKLCNVVIKRSCKINAK